MGFLARVIARSMIIFYLWRSSIFYIYIYIPEGSRRQIHLFCSFQPFSSTESFLDEGHNSRLDCCSHLPPKPTNCGRWWTLRIPNLAHVHRHKRWFQELYNKLDSTCEATNCPRVSGMQGSTTAAIGMVWSSFVILPMPMTSVQTDCSDWIIPVWRRLN